MVAVARDADIRIAQRTNTLLAADALVGDTRWPVKIRNMSQFGAMVETPVKVDVNASIVIKRGTLHAAGEVRWCRNGFIGVRFFEPTVSDEWLGIPTHEAVAPIDDMPSEEARPAEVLLDSVLTWRIAEEIGYIERLISAVASFLSEDPILRVRHCGRVQELSMAAEMMTQLSTVLVSDDKLTTIETTVTGPMKHRMLR